MALPLTETDKFLLLSAVGAPESRDRIVALLDLAGTGNMTGPASATDNAIPRFDGTTGALVQNSGILIDDSNNVSGAASWAGTLFRAGSGSAAAPAFTFTSDLDTGFYRSTTDTIGISSSGIQLASISNLAISYVSSSAAKFRFKETIADSDGLQVFLNGGNSFVNSSGLTSLTLQTNGIDGLSINSTQVVSIGTGLAIGGALNPLGDSGTHLSVLNSTNGTGNLELGSTTVVGAGGNVGALNFLNASNRSAQIFTEAGPSGNNYGTLYLRTLNAGVITNAITISETQNSTFSGRIALSSESGDAAINIASGAGAFLTGTTQYGVLGVPSFVSTAATTEANVFYGLVRTNNAGGTIARAESFFADTAIKGGTDTITRLINYRGVNQTAGTNNAFMADNVAFTGNYFINSTSTNPSSLGGQVRIASLGVANSAAATTPGTVQNKIEVFNASGVSLGFIAVYDAIT